MTRPKCVPTRTDAFRTVRRRNITRGIILDRRFPRWNGREAGRRFQGVGVARPNHIGFIVVDASTTPSRAFVSVPGAPSISALLGSITDTQLHRYNFETLALLDESMKRFGRELSTKSQPVNPHLILVGENAIKDPDELKFFDNVPTALSLDEESVDRLIQIGRRLLRESPEFQKMVTGLKGTLHQE